MAFVHASVDAHTSSNSNALKRSINWSSCCISNLLWVVYLINTFEGFVCRPAALLPQVYLRVCSGGAPICRWAGYLLLSVLATTVLCQSTGKQLYLALIPQNIICASFT